MDDDHRGGISGIQGNGQVAQPPPGHSKSCWAAALGQARRGRPPEDFMVSAERAVDMLETDREVCSCAPINRGVRGRRQR